MCHEYLQLVLAKWWRKLRSLDLIRENPGPPSASLLRDGGSERHAQPLSQADRLSPARHTQHHVSDGKSYQGAPNQAWVILQTCQKLQERNRVLCPPSTEPATSRGGQWCSECWISTAKSSQRGHQLQKCLREQSGWSRSFKAHLQMRNYRPWETDSEMGQKVAIVFVYHCKDLPHPLTSPFLFQMGHPDLNFRQYFWISRSHDEVWKRKSTEGFPGTFANVGGLGFRSGEQRGGRSPQLYFFLLEYSVFFTNPSVTEVAGGRLQWCDWKGQYGSVWGYGWRNLTWGFPFKLNLFLPNRDKG